MICKLISHQWMYKDYSNWILNDGSDYPFRATRICSICNKRQYLESKSLSWENTSKDIHLDIIGKSNQKNKLHNAFYNSSQHDGDHNIISRFLPFFSNIRG